MHFPVEINGELRFIFSEPEMSKALVMKFLRVRPSIDIIRMHEVKKCGLKEIPTICFMDDHHVLVQMKNECDFIHGWAREGRMMEGYTFRPFKWMKDFDIQKESPLAPQWIFLPPSSTDTLISS